MRGINPTTATVHTATTKTFYGRPVLFQACGGNGRVGTGGQVANLIETDSALTCRRCIAAATRAAEKATRAASARKPADVTKMTPIMRKVMTELDSGEWVSWTTVSGGDATMRKLINLGLIEADADEINYRKI